MIDTAHNIALFGTASAACLASVWLGFQLMLRNQSLAINPVTSAAHKKHTLPVKY